MVVADVIIAGAFALLFALALVLGAAWLVLFIAHELVRGF